MCERSNTLLQDLAEPRTIHFYIGPQVGDADVEGRDSALEQQSGVKGVIASRVPD